MKNETEELTKKTVNLHPDLEEFRGLLNEKGEITDVPPPLAQLKVGNKIILRDYDSEKPLKSCKILAKTKDSYSFKVHVGAKLVRSLKKLDFLSWNHFNFVIIGKDVKYKTLDLTFSGMGKDKD